MRRCGRYGQLWSRARSSAEGCGDLGDGGREAQTPSSAAQRQVRPYRCGGCGSGGHGRRYGWRAKERWWSAGGDPDPQITVRQSAVKARTQAANQLQALLVTAPESLRHRLRELTTRDLVDTCGRFRPGSEPDEMHTATKFSLRSVARRYQLLSEEIAELDEQLDRLVAKAAPQLTALPGIGTDHAATLLSVAGDNPQRLKSEASFASLCGVSPIEASSGKVVRHRRNRGGNRGANRALYMICLARMRREPH